MSDVDAEDALQVAQRALSKVLELEEDLTDAHERLDEQEEKLTEQALRLSEHDEERSYDSLTRDDRIGIVREHAFARASDAGGRAALDYKDIKYGAFDGEPSASYCYDLMRLACGTGDRAHNDMSAGVEGFRVRNPDGGNRELIVNAKRAKAARDLLSAKKDRAAQGGI